MHRHGKSWEITKSEKVFGTYTKPDVARILQRNRYTMVKVSCVMYFFEKKKRKKT